MIVELETTLDCPPERAIDEAKKTKLLSYVGRPLLTFIPVDPPQFPDRWEVGQHNTSIRLFGFIPLGSQVIDVSFPQTDSLYCLRDNGHSATIQTWDHVITIDAMGDATLYKDRIVVDAGVLTPIVWTFVWFFFRHRQRRWHRLVANGFRYDDNG